MENPEKSKKHWLVLACTCGMAAASIGISLSVIAVFYSPVAESLGILRGDFAFHSTIASLALAFTSLVIPQLIHRFGWKPSLIVGVILAFIGTSGMAFTTNIIGFYLLGALRGAGTALFAMVPLTTIVNNWFEEKNGMAMSLSFGFSGIAGAIFSPVFAWLIEVTGWENAFILKGLLIVLLCLPAIFYPYSLTPKDDGYLPYGESNDEEIQKGMAKKEEFPAFSFVSIAFIALLLFSFLHTNIIGVSQHLPGFGESLGLSSQLGSWMMSAVMVGNITFKLIIGSLSDTLGIVKSTILMIGFNMFAIILLLTMQHPVFLIIGSWLFGSIFCVPDVAFPLLSRQLFGRAAATRVFPVLTFSMGIGGAISVTIVGYIFDFTGSYVGAFLIALGFHVINIALLYLSVKFAPKSL